MSQSIKIRQEKGQKNLKMGVLGEFQIKGGRYSDIIRTEHMICLVYKIADLLGNLT
jgi:hypothetical protein